MPPPPDFASPPPFRFRPTALVAWLVIVGVCVALPLLRAGHKTASSATRPAGPEAVDFQTTLVGRYAVGAAKLSPGQSGVFNDFIGTTPKTTEARIAAAIVTGELVGPGAARRQLDAIDDPDAAAFAGLYPNDAATRPTTTRPATTEPATAEATTAPSAAALRLLMSTTRPGIAALRPRFGWFARLAESFGKPDDEPARAAVLGEAERTVLVIGGAAGVIFGAIVLGVALFVTAIVLFAVGRLRFAVGRPAGPGHVYVESVAIYLGGFVLVSLAIAAWVADPPMGLNFVGLGSVVALAAVWPLLRGVPFDVLRRDWGVHRGRGVFVEMLAGLGGYLAGLPVVLAGVGVTIVILRFTHGDATHPIAREIGSGSLWLLFGLASVFAPLTEELLFRGALVSHLRAGMNAAAAAAVSGVVFAAVHPQGWAAVPALASIGAVLALVRQWRGSLVASITAHAINNGFVLALLALATR